MYICLPTSFNTPAISINSASFYVISRWSITRMYLNCRVPSVIRITTAQNQRHPGLRFHLKASHKTWETKRSNSVTLYDWNLPRPSFRTRVTCWTICYWSYQLAVGKCMSHLTLSFNTALYFSFVSIFTYLLILLVGRQFPHTFVTLFCW